MSLEADNAIWSLGDALSDLPQEQKVYYVRQLLIELMDYTEQSDEEKLWCNLNEDIKRRFPDYAKYETLRAETQTPMKITKDQENIQAVQGRLALFETFGFIVPVGSTFYKLKDKDGNGKWGLKVGEYTHSCHIDTTVTVILLFIDDMGQTSIEECSDLWLESVVLP